MTGLKSGLRLLYRGMLACYPTATRSEFGEEMLYVFDEASADRAACGVIALLVYFLREMRDWPRGLFSAYRSEYLQRGYRGQRFTKVPAPGWVTWKEGVMDDLDGRLSTKGKRSIWISLPPLLLGLGIMVSALVRTDVWYRLPRWQLTLSVGILFLPGMVVAVVGLIALVRRIPDWGITWMGSAFMGFVLTMQVTLGEFIDEGVISMHPAVEAALGLGLFLTGLTLLLVLAVRGWSRSGLFTLAAAATMGLSLLQAVTAAPFNRDDLALLAGPLGLTFTLLIFFYLQKPGVSRWAALVITGLLNVGIVLITTHAWLVWRAPPEATGFITPLLIMLTGLLVVGPISGLLIKPILDQRG